MTKRAKSAAERAVPETNVAGVDYTDTFRQLYAQGYEQGWKDAMARVCTEKIW